MLTCSILWKKLSQHLDQRNINAFLERLGRSTDSRRAVLYRSVCDVDSVVTAEWSLPDVDELDSEGTLRTMTIPLAQPGDCLAIQRRGARFTTADDEILQMAGLLLEQSRDRWQLEELCRETRAQLDAVTQNRSEWEASAQTWERRAHALDAYSKGLTHHCLTHGKMLTHLTSAIREETGFCPPVVREKLAKLEVLANRSSQLSQALLATARSRAAGTNLERVSIAELFNETRTELGEVVEATRATIGRGSLPTVLGDRQLLKSILSALLTNALAYCSDPRIYLEVSETIDEYHFILHDNGPGIPVHLREAVFVPFRRLHTAEETPGVGLGLTHCRESLAQLGGRVWLSDSSRERGLAVHFTIARSD